MTPRKIPVTATGADDLAYYRHLMDIAAEYTSDGRPSVGADLLLETLRREHGVERPDIPPETIPKPQRILKRKELLIRHFSSREKQP
jgi:hypothetical protein